MSVTLTVAGVAFEYPETGDSDWGDPATGWALAMTNSTLQLDGGAFILTAEVDFGPDFGLKALYFRSAVTPTADADFLRLAHTDALAWRNFTDDGNLRLSVDNSNQLLFDGIPLGFSVPRTFSDTATIDMTLSVNDVTSSIVALSITDSLISSVAAIARTKLADGTPFRILRNNALGVMSENGALTASRAVVTDSVSQLVSSAATAIEVGYLTGVTSLIQGQLNDRPTSVFLASIANGQGASTIGLEDAGLSYDSANVEAAFAELASTSSGQGASIIGNVPFGFITAINVQAALDGLDSRMTNIQLASVSSWRYGTTTAEGDPGPGFFRSDTVIMANITKLWMDDINQAGVDVRTFLLTLTVGTVIYTQQLNDSARFILYTISADPIGKAGYVELPISVISSGSVFEALNDCGFVRQQAPVRAQDVSLVDVANNYVATNVEDAFTEIGGPFGPANVVWSKDTESPNSGYIIPAIAGLTADTNNPELTSALFSSTVEQGRGFDVVTPTGAVSIVVEIVSRAETAPGAAATAAFKLYAKQLSAGVWSAWDVGQTLTDITYSTDENWITSTYTLALSGMSLLAGAPGKLEFTRVDPSGGTELVPDVAVQQFTYAWTV